MTKPASAAIAGRKFFNDFEFSLHHWHENHLRETRPGLDYKCFMAAIPAGHKDLALIIRINQTNKVTKHDAVLMAETRTRQNDRGERRIRDVDGYSARNQLRCAGFQGQGFIDARA